MDQAAPLCLGGRFLVRAAPLEHGRAIEEKGKTGLPLADVSPKMVKPTTVRPAKVEDMAVRSLPPSAPAPAMQL